jgi:signal transduction histidine kinase
VTDGSRLRQIVLNGLTNAVKFASASATRITVSVDIAAGSVITFSVIDDGSGLPDSVTQDALFHDFNTTVSAHSVAVLRRRDTVRTTGVGLPISSK